MIIIGLLSDQSTRIPYEIRLDPIQQQPWGLSLPKSVSIKIRSCDRVALVLQALHNCRIETVQSGDYNTSFVNQSINAVPLCLPQQSETTNILSYQNSRSEFCNPKRQLLSFVQLADVTFAAARSTFRIFMSTAVTTAGINYHTWLTTVNNLSTTPESLSCFKLARHSIEASSHLFLVQKV